MPFFCYCKSSLQAKIVGKLLLAIKIMPGLVELLTINVGYGVYNYMTVKMFLVLMDTDNILMSGEKSFGIQLTQLKNLCRCYIFILMKTHDLMGVHPAGILIPKSFLL